jgi:hypothetical protein
MTGAAMYPSDWLWVPESCPIRAQVKLPRDDLPAQGAVALFTEKRKLYAFPSHV